MASHGARTHRNFPCMRKSSRVVFAIDFTGDPLGGFPRKFDLKSGNVAVAGVKGKRVLPVNSSGEFAIVLPEVLPQRFTMEFEISGPDSWYQDLLFADDEDPYFATIRPGLDSGLAGPDAFRVAPELGSPADEGALTKVRIMADGTFVKVYMNGTRVANAPSAKIGRSKWIRFRVTADEEGPVLFANFHIAAGGRISIAR
jgi:OmpA-OmpF porin, OOP family